MKVLICVFLLLSCVSEPRKTVVLTFDDSVKSQAEFVAPLLKKYGFNATFFITEGFSFKTRKDLYMTWEEIRGLHEDGFEIGNHTQHHRNVRKLSVEEIHASLDHIETQCKKHGIPKPVSFCYPGYATSEKAVAVLKERGYKYARCGGERPCVLGKENPFLLPQAFDGKPKSTLEQFIKAVDQADDKHVPILTFHGVPDIEHPWVNTDQEKFLKYMNYLKDNKFKVIALKDLPEPE